MLSFLDQRPVMHFLAQVFGLALLAGILIAVAGLVLRWSSKVDYSDGFFFASFFLAVVGSIRSMMAPRAALLRKTPVDPPDAAEAGWNRLERFLAHTSLNFKLILAAGLCLLFSILISLI